MAVPHYQRFKFLELVAVLFLGLNPVLSPDGVAMTSTFQVAGWRKGQGRVPIFSMLPESWSAVVSLSLSLTFTHLVPRKPRE